MCHTAVVVRRASHFCTSSAPRHSDIPPQRPVGEMASLYALSDWAGGRLRTTLRTGVFLSALPPLQRNAFLHLGVRVHVSGHTPQDATQRLTAVWATSLDPPHPWRAQSHTLRAGWRRLAALRRDAVWLSSG